MKNVKLLYQRLRALQWPTLAGSVGNFALYESLLAGCADRVARGKLLDVSRIPVPDEETVGFVAALRNKENLTSDEACFLEYFDLMEEIRSTLTDER